MTAYADLEILGGEPVELFKFVYGSTSWFWTSGIEEINKDGDLYEPSAIVSSHISANEEAQTNSTQITVNADNEIAVLFKTNQPSSIISVTVFRKQRDSADFISAFVGEVATCQFGDVNAVLDCTPMQAITQRKLATLIYQITCNNRLGDTRCQVNMAGFSYSYDVTDIVVSQDECNIALGGNADTFFTGSMEGWLTGGTVKFDNTILMITGQGTAVFSGANRIAVMGRFDNLNIGDTVIVKAGCDKLVATCRDKFNNLPRHQGFPYSPSTSPAKVGAPATGLGWPFFGNP